jgi:hypothetical protein
MAKVEIQKVSATHDKIIDIILSTNHKISYQEIASVMGYSPEMIGIIVRSDSFKTRLHERRQQVIDPMIVQKFEETLEELGDMAARTLMERIKARELSSKDLIGVVNASANAKKYGARGQDGPVGPAGVVFVPVPAASAEAWSQKALAAGAPMIPAFPMPQQVDISRDDQ